jgi:hypothetical protein
MKRRGETLSPETKHKRLCTEAVQLEHFPTELLIYIIQQVNLIYLRGLLCSCKKFYSLVFKHVKTISLQNEREMPRLEAMLKQMQIANPSRTNLETLVTWFPASKSPGLFKDETLSSLIQFPNLSTLLLCKGKVTNLTREGFLHFTALKKLVHFELDDCTVDVSDVIPVLRSLSHLQNLRMRGMTGENDKLISSLATTSLKRLGFWKATERISDSEFAYLSRQTGLQELILANCRSQVRDSFQHIAKLTQLCHLGLFCDNISNQQIERLKTLRGLSSLHLAGCWEVENESASGLCLQLPELTRLAVSRAPLITKQFLNSIRVMSLRGLFLSNCTALVDEDFQILCSLSTLQRLDLELSLQLGNKTLENIAMHRSLSELRLTSLFNISDEGIKSLLGMINLTTLYVKQCNKITKAGIDVLRKDHVNSLLEDGLKIYYKPFSNAPIPDIDDDD